MSQHPAFIRLPEGRQSASYSSEGSAVFQEGLRDSVEDIASVDVAYMSCTGNDMQIRITVVFVKLYANLRQENVAPPHNIKRRYARFCGVNAQQLIQIAVECHPVEKFVVCDP